MNISDGNNINLLKLEELRCHLKKAIPLLEEHYKENSSGMMELILKRYKNALAYIETTEPNQLKWIYFHLIGGARAYLECSSDYEHPIIRELGEAEELLRLAFNKES